MAFHTQVTCLADITTHQGKLNWHTFPKGPLCATRHCGGTPHRGKCEPPSGAPGGIGPSPELEADLTPMAAGVLGLLPPFKFLPPNISSPGSPCPPHHSRAVETTAGPGSRGRGALVSRWGREGQQNPRACALPQLPKALTPHPCPSHPST